MCDGNLLSSETQNVHGDTAVQEGRAVTNVIFIVVLPMQFKCMSAVNT